MAPILALTICLALVSVLLFLERKRNPDGSFALWVPTIWLLLCASKPIGTWLAIGKSNIEFNPEAGSPYDRLVLSILIILALVILYRRKIEWSMILKDNFWFVFLLVYLGISILWSDFPFVSFKRWFRIAGGFIIALVILSERSPHKAMESVLRRCAYVLLPLSLILIKYYQAYGIQYTQWEGMRMWVGVTSHKNRLGVLCSISAFLIFWSLLKEWRAGAFLKSKSQTFAEVLVFGISLFLLFGYHGVYPATAIGFLFTGICSLLFLYQIKNNLKNVATILVLSVIFGLLSLTFVQSIVPVATSLFHRNESFTGRSEIWHAVIDVASRKPMFGYGYGAYWGLQDEEIVSSVHVSESHSGYLDVYLDVGIVGTAVLFVFIFAYFRKALSKLDDSLDWGLFGICMLIMTLLHNFTESNFLRTSSYFWNLFVFLSVVLTTSRSYTYINADVWHKYMLYLKSTEGLLDKK